MMKAHPDRHNASAQPTAHIVCPVPGLGAASRISGPFVAAAPRRRHVQSDKVSPCAHLICSKQPNFFASIPKSYDSAPKREHSWRQSRAALDLRRRRPGGPRPIALCCSPASVASDTEKGAGMSLRKRGGIWWVDVAAPNGERVRRTTGTANKALAQEFHDRTKSELWRIAKLGEKPRRTWNEAAVRWLKEQSHKATAAEESPSCAG